MKIITEAFCTGTIETSLVPARPRGKNTVGRRGRMGKRKTEGEMKFLGEENYIVVKAGGLILNYCRDRSSSPRDKRKERRRYFSLCTVNCFAWIFSES